MIQVSNLSKSYGTQVIFENVGFAINRGERIGLVGRNGHGKTTLLKMITGEEKPDDGSISIPNGYSVGYLSQHLEFASDSVIDEACLGLTPSEDGRDESYKAETILTGLGFSTDDFLSHPLDLSGGYQVRLNLAKLLVSGPNLLLLDEPTNYLDIVSIRWLMNFLRGWREELILITHDREFMDGVTTHTMGIHRNGIRKIEGETAKLYQQILMEEELYEQTRINEEKKRREVEQFINRFRAQATRARAVQSKIKALRRHEKLEKMVDMEELEFKFNPAPFTGKTLLDARGVTFSFEAAALPLIEGLDLTIGKRDRIAVIGKNGKGKSTLLSLLEGGLQPLSGEVTRHPQLKTAYFAQTNVQQLSPDKTVEQEILDVLPVHNIGAARNICGVMMFEGDLALKKISVLSGGEKSRVLLGKLIARPANLLLLDEPTNHLDMESIDSLIEAMDTFAGAVMIVTHSEMILNAVATRLVVFDGGKVSLFEGTYRDFLERRGWKDETDALNGAKKAGNKTGISADRKEFRRLKAELINSRSRALTPLQTRISEVEETITGLEQEMNKDTHALVRASAKGNGAAIQRISISIHEAWGKIDALFDEIETLTNELNEKSREFEERFAALTPIIGP